jgi:hypothetical protein
MPAALTPSVSGPSAASMRVTAADRRRIGHICDNGNCPAARGEDLRGGGLHVPLDLIDAADERARTSKPYRYCPADPTAGTSDERDTTVQ